MPTLPIPSGAETAGIVAMYDVSDDWIPIYDKSSLPGYYMAIGTSGNQFKCTGPAGYLMASIIEYVCIAYYFELGHGLNGSLLSS
jgi:sarcosine oxidase subunit beta